MILKIDKELKNNNEIKTPSLSPNPSKEFLESLKEMEDYKKGKVKLDTYNDVSEIFKALNDK